MADFISELLKAQLDTVLVLGGVILVLIAAVGNISGKIQPGREGRIASAVAGPILITVGLWMHIQQHSATTKKPDSASDGAQTAGIGVGGNRKQNPSSGTPKPNVTSVNSPKDLGYFGGIWKNIDSNTRGITTIQIRLDNDKAFVHTWGRCHPTDCDWGEVSASLFAPNVSLHQIQSIAALYKTTFSETQLTLRPADRDTIQIDTSTHFSDTSGRSDYTASYRLRRDQ